MRLLPAILLFSVFFTGIAAGVEQEVSPTGGHSDQKVINDAIDNVAQSGGGTVFLKAGTFIVDGPVMMRSNIKLTGDSSAVIKVYSGSSQWFQGSIGIISNAENLNNIEISGFQVDGSVTELPPGYHQSRSDTAHDCERCILFAGDSGNMMDNIGIHDMTLFDSFSDGVYIRFCDNAHVYNNFISNTQHEGVFLTCNKYSLIESNRVAGITSDCLRLDNCQNCEVRDNLCFSYNGTHASNTYIHGESGIQVGNSGVSHGYDGRNKPFYTLNIFVHDNSFINNGLNAVVIDDGLTNANIYFTNNIIIGHKDLETSGFPIESIGNYSYEHPPSKEMSEKVFGSIFDILAQDFYSQVGVNDSLILPEGIKTVPTEAAGTIEYVTVGQTSYTLVILPTDGLSEVQYVANGVTIKHTLMIGEKTPKGIKFTKTSIWSGAASNNGDSLKLDGKIPIADIQVKCITPRGSFTPTFKLTSIENSSISVHPAIFFLFGIVLIGIIAGKLIFKSIYS